MKKQILKIAGVKSEKEFYKKFPTEEAFMAKHGKELKKAQIGTYMTTMYQPVDVRGIYDEIDYQLTGMTAADRAQIEAAKQAAAQSAQSGGAGGGGGIDMSQLAQFAEMAGGAKKGKKIPKAQPGRVQTGGLPRTQLGNVTGAQPGLPRTQLGNVTDRGPMPVPSPFPTAATTKKPVNWAQGIPIAGKIIGGIQKSKEAKKLLQQTIQQEKLTDVMGQAAASRPVQQPRRQYVRPEDMAFQPEQMFPSYGVGTNVLAQDGTVINQIGGNPTEIQNMYNPGTLYSDLGYEPLNDSERYKQFYHGGKMHKAQNGLEKFMSEQGGNEIFGAIDQLGAFNDGGGDIGSGIGEALGSFIPGSGPILPVVGRVIGSALDQKKEKTEASQERTTQNINEIAGQNFGIGIQQQFGANLQDGGTTSPYKWVSHTWQPQVIASFGGHNVKDLLKPPHDADMLRAGGHLKAYTPPSAAAMSTERPVMQMGGELKTHWGGYAEPMSYNPYLPDGGETIMFRGQSHDESDGRGNTGIGITYGENPVEVERGEPAMKMQDGGSPGDSSLVVFGNLNIPKAYVPFLGEEAKGKKFKNYVADLSNKENLQNKKLDKATQMLEDFEVSTPIDKMTLNSLQYTMLGANQKLKDIAEKKMQAASLQNAINDTAEEYGLIADDLAKGRVKMDKKAMKEAAKFGKEIEKAQFGFYGPIMPSLGRAKTMQSVMSGLRMILPSGASIGGMPVSGIPASSTAAAPAQPASSAAPVRPTLAFNPVAPAAPLSTYSSAVEEEEEEAPADPITAAVATVRPVVANNTIPDYPIATTDEEKVSQIMDLYQKAEAAEASNPGKKNPYALELQKRYHMYFPEIAEKIILGAGDVTARAKSKGITSLDELKKRSRTEILDTNVEGYMGPRTKQYIANLPKKTPSTTPSVTPSGDLNVQRKTATTTTEKTTTPPTGVQTVPYKRNPLLDVIGQVLPYLRPTNTEELDPRQLIGEMYALANNQLEGVQAQTLQPQLSVPYDISYQDILNENEAAFRSQQRMLGYNPAFQSQLNAQKYQANQKVLAEQFRANQAMKDQVYSQNRNLLNQYGLQNLEILDRQYQRQETAKSKTKAITQAALSSIGDKYLRNQLENRKLATMENLYNYRYDPRFRTVNMNAPFQPQVPTVYIGPDGKQYQMMPVQNNSAAPSQSVPAAAPSAPQVQPLPTIDFEERQFTTDELSGGTSSGRKGINVSKKKGLNSSVVRAFKNL
jgi:hypothetical protein